MHGPSPATRHPIAGAQRVGFLKNFVTRPNIVVGDFTYYDDPRGVERFEDNVLYHFDFIGDRLVIGRFCSIAAGTTFIMNGGSHPTDWITTYPFPVFGEGWEAGEPPSWPSKGDTVVGHDVWLGYRSTVLPGVEIGHGAIVAAESVVTKDVEPFAIVAGNPARTIRFRFDEQACQELLEISWWDWETEKITRNVAALCSGDLAALRNAS
jgi:virginiamycin A acetyltransferase